MPKLLIVGDSISMGYTETVAAELAGAAEVVHSPGNASDCTNIVATIDARLADAQPQTVVLNCGLHDVKRARDSDRCQVPLMFYKTILPAIIEKVRAAGCRCVWVNTTPVIEKLHRAAKSFDRFNKDIDDYNKAAREIVRKAKLPIINLNKAARNLGLETALTGDGVHFTPEAYEALGKKIAARLREVLQ
jgi:lysophospholipase L1-like esterase